MFKRFIDQWRADRAELDHYFDRLTPADLREAERRKRKAEEEAILWSPLDWEEKEVNDES